MLTLGIANFILLSQISYIIAERRVRFYRSAHFWMSLDGLLLSLYMTIWYMTTPTTQHFFFW